MIFNTTLTTLDMSFLGHNYTDSLIDRRSYMCSYDRRSYMCLYYKEIIHEFYDRRSYMCSYNKEVIHVFI